MTAISDPKSKDQHGIWSDKPFQLACWRVDPARNLLELHVSGDRRPAQRQLEPRLMQLLCLLAREAGTVLTRETLIQTLWPTVIVTENSLTRAISDLRLKLAEPGEERSRLIETIPKRGYRLIANPVWLSPTESTHVNSTASRAAPLFLRWAPAMATAILLFVSLAMHLPVPSGSAPGDFSDYSQLAQGIDWQDAVLSDAEKTAWVVPRLTVAQQPPARLQEITEVVPGFLTGSGRSVITPDGQLMAYVEQVEGVSRLNLKATLSGDEPWTAFTTTEQIYHLQWSPLDAGLLFTVGLAAQHAEQPAYVRLMLLDLESLVLHELYRRELPESLNVDHHHSSGGSLT
jgi:DNA-binding winged helix-turn-helix (wHTH) protein